MKGWHDEHMEKTVLKYVKGLPDGASAWEKRNHKKYGNLVYICKQIEYDIRHGAAHEQVRRMFRKIHDDPSFSVFDGSRERLEEIQNHFEKPKIDFR